MKEDNAKEIIRKAEEWRKQICICDQCYTSSVALVFPPLRQKIMFISESPFKFPRKECKTLECFLEKDFLENVKRKSESIIPANIFDFLYKLFRPLFSDTPTKQDITKFLRRIYWTHISKKSLKCLSGSKIKCAKMCSASIIKELKEIRPELIIIASSVALQILFNRGYKESFEKQVEKIRKCGTLLTVKELIHEKGKPLLSEISVLQNCEVAVFPNPSPAAKKWKKEAYGKVEIKNVLSYIDQYCKSAY